MANPEHLEIPKQGVDMSDRLDPPPIVVLLRIEVDRLTREE
jgi:hypothetical protein